MGESERVSMRKKWFEFVATTRKRMSRKLKKQVSHREAMKEASVAWPKEKVRILNKIKREAKKAMKRNATHEAECKTCE